MGDRWRKSRAACRDFGADSIDIAIYASDGGFINEFSEFRDDFSTSADLLPDVYTIDATLLDVNGADVRTTVADSQPVYRLKTSVSAIDFPADSFL